MCIYVYIYIQRERERDLTEIFDFNKTKQIYDYNIIIIDWSEFDETFEHL